MDTNSYRLSFLGGGTLKDIFDAGLRPVRDRTTGYYGEVEEKIVVLKVPGGDDFELFADRCRFRVGEGGLLSELSVFSPNLTVDETLLQMKPLVRAFGAQEASLQFFLEKVRQGHSRFGGVNDGIEGYGVSTPRPRSRSGEVWMAARLDWTGNATRPIQIAVMT